MLANSLRFVATISGLCGRRLAAAVDVDTRVSCPAFDGSSIDVSDVSGILREDGHPSVHFPDRDGLNVTLYGASG
ncbi:hypothetical protein FPOAC2_13469 [Fusarium poae]